MNFYCHRQVRLTTSVRRSALVLLAVLSLPLAHAGSSGVILVPGIVGQAFPRSAFQFVLHVPVTNRGTVSASNVVVNSATANGQTPVSPPLPVTLGVIMPGSAADLQLNFDRNYFPTGSKTTLTVKGTYSVGGSPYGFQMSIPLTVFDAGTPDGTSESQSAQRLPDPPCSGQDPQGFCPPDPTTPVENENETPPVPNGLPRAVPSVPQTDINVNFDPGGGGFSGPQGPAPLAATDPLRFSIDRNFNGDIPLPPPSYGAKSTNVLDPTVARNNGDIVLITGNWYLGVSLNGGTAVTALDPTAIFPAYPGGRRLCSDQLAHYSPDIDRYIYIGISCAPEMANAISDLRIAVARPADIQADRTANPPTNNAWRNGTYTLDSNFLNTPNMWLDFPDVAVGRTYLSVTGNIYQRMAAQGGGFQDQYSGYYTLSVLLTDLQNPPAGGPTYYLLFWNNAAVDGTSGRLAQDGGSNQHLAAHIDTSTLRVSEWNSATRVWTLRNVGHASYSDTRASYTIAGGNQPQWLSSGMRDEVVGATERFPAGANGELWFAWTAGGMPAPSMYTRPYIQIARIDQVTWTLLENKLIWNPGFAWAFPSLATNSNAEVGMAAMVGTEDGNPNFGVSILTGTFANASDNGGTASNARWGDYMTIRRDGKNAKLFSATGYSRVAPPATYRIWYSRFGRSTDVINGP